MSNPPQSTPSGEGSLVAKLAAEPIRALMSPDPIVVSPETKLRAALDLMRGGRKSCVLIRDDESLVGIFTERDYLDGIAGVPELLDEPVSNHMSTEPRALAPSAALGQLLQVIASHGYRHLPVVEDGEILGVVVAQDIVKYIAELFPAEVYNLPPQLDQVMPRVEGA